MQLARLIWRVAKFLTGVGSCRLGTLSVQVLEICRGHRVKFSNPVNRVCSQDRDQAEVDYQYTLRRRHVDSFSQVFVVPMLPSVVPMPLAVFLAGDAPRY